jgi:membrane peptidoglycan carboxypeptidase
VRALANVLSYAALLLLRRRASSLLAALGTAYCRYARGGKRLVSPNLISALLIAEDRRFYHHGGVDVIATLRAAWYCIFRGRLVGGSTLEQQLVRTLSGDKARSVRRKFREIFLCTLVSRIVPKAEVPGLYLSVAYFGWRMNGLRDACARLGFVPERLSLRQAASVVARLKYPEPERRSEPRRRQIKSRTEYILRTLARSCGERSPVRIEARESETLLDF